MQINRVRPALPNWKNLSGVRPAAPSDKELNDHCWVQSLLAEPPAVRLHPLHRIHKPPAILMVVEHSAVGRLGTEVPFMPQCGPLRGSTACQCNNCYRHNWCFHSDLQIKVAARMMADSSTQYHAKTILLILISTSGPAVRRQTLSEIVLRPNL